MAKRGRPRGLTLNDVAIDDLLLSTCTSKGELAEAGGITTGHLADALYRRKGVSPEAVRGMAARLKVKPGHICPELTDRFIGIREGDLEDVA